MARPRRLLLLLPVACVLGGVFLISGLVPPIPESDSPAPRPPAPPEDRPTPEEPVPVAASAEPWKGRLLAGRILAASDDAPIAGAVVAAMRTREKRTERGPEIRTGAAGRYEVRLAEKEPELWVAAEGYTSVRFEVPDHVEALDVRLERRGGFEGRVVPLPTAVLFPVPSSGSSRSSPFTTRISSATRGWRRPTSRGATASTTSPSAGPRSTRWATGGRHASSPEDWGGPETVVAAGTEGVRLAYRPSRSLVVRIRDWPEGETEVGKLTIGGPDSRVTHSVRPTDGVFRFSRLPPGREVTFFCLLPDDRIAYRTGIPASESEVVVSLVPGGTVTGRLILPRAEPLPRVSADGRGWKIGTRVDPDGSFVIRGIPAGPVRISAWGCVDVDGEHRHFDGEAATTAGETVEVRVEIR